MASTDLKRQNSVASQRSLLSITTVAQPNRPSIMIRRSEMANPPPLSPPAARSLSTSRKPPTIVTAPAHPPQLPSPRDPHAEELLRQMEDTARAILHANIPARRPSKGRACHKMARSRSSPGISPRDPPSPAHDSHHGWSTLSRSQNASPVDPKQSPHPLLEPESPGLAPEPDCPDRSRPRFSPRHTPAYMRADESLRRNLKLANISHISFEPTPQLAPSVVESML